GIAHLTAPAFTLSLHDALPIFVDRVHLTQQAASPGRAELLGGGHERTNILRQTTTTESETSVEEGLADATVRPQGGGQRGDVPRSEEHTSELQSRFDLVCRLLL